MRTMEHLTEEQINYLCSKIPAGLAKAYFNQFPKQFQKLEKGFRAKSLSDEQVATILFRHHHHGFIEDFLVKNLNAAIDRVQEAVNLESSDSYDDEIYLEVLGDSIFDENVAMFFQLIEQEHSPEYIQLMEAAIRREKRIRKRLLEVKREMDEDAQGRENTVAALKDQISNKERQEKKLKENLRQQTLQLESRVDEIEQKDRAIDELSTKMSELTDALKGAEKQIDELKSRLARNDEKQEAMQKEWQQYKSAKDAEKENDRTKVLEEKVSQLITEGADLETAVEKLNQVQRQTAQELSDLLKAVEEMEHRKFESETLTVAAQGRSSKPKRPLDMDLFEEFFEYNLNSMGLSDKEETYDSFLRYIQTIVFDGVPLLIKMVPGINLANGLANTLGEKSTATSIYFDPDGSVAELKTVIDHNADRVLCIHNVIGSAQELPVLMLLQNYRDKIIILTYPADRTLYYLPEELLSQVHYLNLDGYASMASTRDMEESPTSMEEAAYEMGDSIISPKHQGILSEIGHQCGLSKEAMGTMSAALEDGETLDAILLFTLLPYVSKVLMLNPYAESRRLESYAGAEGSSRLKKSMLEWFDR